MSDGGLEFTVVRGTARGMQLYANGTHFWQENADGTRSEWFEPFRGPRLAEGAAPCRVYWGSHGCCLERGHEGEHLCECTYAEDGSLLPHMDDDPDEGNVGRAPYYGPETSFFGEDAPEADASH